MFSAAWTRRFGAFRRLGIAAALMLAVTGLAACGASEEPSPDATQAASLAAPAASEAPPDTTGVAAPSAKLAPAFELPNAAGETVSLASYAGDKNVVLVFYRGFW